MKKKAITIGIVVLVLLSLAVTAYAAVYSYKMTYLPGTTDTVTNLPDSDGGTGGNAYIVSSQIPERKGYVFLHWTLDYGPAYEVTYIVKPDPVYGVPDDSIVPTDLNRYAPGDWVTVANRLTTTETYGINAKTGEKRPGTWTFVPWDKDDFNIYADTIITGEWKFISKYKYTVHHLDIDTYQQLADDEVVWIDELTQVTPTSKTPKTEFYTAYQKSKYNPVTEKVYENKRKDFLLPGSVYSKNKTKYVITVTLTEDDQHIFFFYQRPTAGMTGPTAEPTPVPEPEPEIPPEPEPEIPPEPEPEIPPEADPEIPPEGRSGE